MLAVGTLEPRKNLPRLVAAYGSCPRRCRPSTRSWSSARSAGRRARRSSALRSLGERCTLLGYVSDAALAELYRRCAVFCYPSLGEGFGLPVLEAMAAGAAVLTSNVSSLPEVGGDAVDYADPCDRPASRAALRDALELSREARRRWAQPRGSGRRVQLEADRRRRCSTCFETRRGMQRRG